MLALVAVAGVGGAAIFSTPTGTAVASTVARVVQDPLSVLGSRSPGARGSAAFQTKIKHARVASTGRQRTAPGAPRQRVLSVVRDRGPAIIDLGQGQNPSFAYVEPGEVPSTGPLPAGLGSGNPGVGYTPPFIGGGGGFIGGGGGGGGGTGETTPTPEPPVTGTEPPPPTNPPVTPPTNPPVTPPTEPPVTPPTNPPVTPPTNPPVTPPTEPPVTPPTNPPVTPPTNPPVTPPTEPPVTPPTNPPVTPPTEPPVTPPLEPPIVPPAIPEPATWLLMMLGFGATGWMLRRRHTERAAVPDTVARG